MGLSPLRFVWTLPDELLCPGSSLLLTSSLRTLPLLRLILLVATQSVKECSTMQSTSIPVKINIPSVQLVCRRDSQHLKDYPAPCVRIL